MSLDPDTEINFLVQHSRGYKLAVEAIKAAAANPNFLEKGSEVSR